MVVYKIGEGLVINIQVIQEEIVNICKKKKEKKGEREILEILR